MPQRAKNCVPEAVKGSLPRLLLTRARPQAEAFAQVIRNETGLTPIISPMQEMRDLPAEINLSDVTSLAFTSKNGVEAFTRNFSARLPAYCVGQATAERARALGFEATAAAGNVESLREILPKSGVLHLHGRHLTGALGIRHVAIYDQVALALENDAENMLRSGEIEAIALFSPRSARLFAAVWQPNWPQLRHIYALSAAVATPVRAIGQPKICAAPSAEAMLRLISADYPA